MTRIEPQNHPHAATARTGLSTGRRVLLSLALAGLAATLSARVALGAAAPAAAAPGAQPEAVKPASAPAAEVKLLAPGAEPRKVLRLHAKAGDKHTVTITLKTGLDMQVGGMDGQMVKMPALKMVMDSTVKNVLTNGDFAYETVMTDVSLTEDADAMPMMVEAMKSMMGGLKGLSVSGTTSNRGLDKETEGKAPADLDPQMRQAMEQMNESFSQTRVGLPEEAVGVGAKWEVKMKIKTQGVTADEVATYELVSLEGDRATTKVSVKQNAANQKIQNPFMPGMEMEVVKMAAKGTGEVTLDLGQLTPSEVNLELHDTRSMSMRINDQPTSMDMKMDLNLHSETK